jgi:pimeloyl-ACP methyl ester carboxylesterase
MSSSRNLPSARRIALTIGVGLVCSAFGAAVVSMRRWGGKASPTGGDPLALGDGIDSVCVTDDGARLAVRVLGTGDAGDVVLPHCWMGSRRFWGPVAQRLTASGHRVVVYDQRGHGASTVGGGGLTIAALGDDLEAVLRHVDARDAVVAGHSLGGMTAQSFLIRHADRASRLVRGVVLVSTACDFRGSIERLRRADPLFGARMTRLYRHPVIGPLMLRNIEGREPSLSHLRAQAQAVVETPPEVRVAFLQAMAAMDLTAELASVDVPVIVLVGERDNVTTPAQARRLADAIPGARLEQLPDLGHMLLWDAPDRVVEAITELGRAPGSGESGRAPGSGESGRAPGSGESGRAPGVSPGSPRPEGEGRTPRTGPPLRA